jgi:uncharacterized repeat protein (TIGR01451 family)
MTRTLRRALLAGLLLAPFAARPAMAQSPTLEGTTITNTATASWTDANGNTYTPATASVSVTVGFKAGPDAVSPTTVTPSSPSTGNELNFTIINGGNGVDSVSVAATAGTGVTITGYKIGSTTYATIEELNAALASTPINPANGPAPAGSVVVTVVYTVASGQGGQTIPVTLTATSLRTPGVSDASTTNVTPAVAGAVNVTPDGGTVNRLPSNGTQYTAVYTVQNTGNANDTYALALTTSGGGTVSIVSVNGAAGTSSSVTVPSGGSTTVNVVYTVSNSAAAGATETMVLTATSGNNPAQSDPGSYTVTVIRAAISMTKEAFRDNQTTAITAADRVVPGEYIQYRITVTNTGQATATLNGASYGITDALPSQVTYASASGDAAGWTISESSGTVTATLTGTLAPSASRSFWIRVQVK